MVAVQSLRRVGMLPPMLSFRGCWNVAPGPLMGAQSSRIFAVGGGCGELPRLWKSERRYLSHLQVHELDDEVGERKRWSDSWCIAGCAGSRLQRWSRRPST